MNRTQMYLAAAAGLAVMALVVGLPRFVAGHPQPAAFSGAGALTMTARLSHPYVPVGQTDVFATVDIKGVEVPGATRAPVNLALVLDRSGSMAGAKLDEAKLAAQQLIGQLGPSDRLAIVHYGSDVRSQPGLYATEENKRALMNFVANITDDGGTNIGAALTTARELLVASKAGFKVNRMILISDGQPTEGVTDAAGLTNLVKEARAMGISVSSIGVGDDFQESLMAAFAEVGGGAYGYLKDTSQLATIFRKDLAQAGTQVAHNVVLHFELPDDVTLGEVLGYQAMQSGHSVAVPMPDVSAGQLDRMVVRLKVQASSAGRTVEVSNLRLSYFDELSGGPGEARVQLAALVTDQFELVAKNLDKDATVFAARARSADNTRRAGDLLNEGRAEEAQALLQENGMIFEEAAKVAGPAAVAPDVAGNNALSDTFLKGERKDAAKKALSKARMDYGLMGSTY
ncbi:MAG: VWA domain-containing protein [Myxococcaceae bacterium]|nr:VWA domain-containing protein [Myxococcaceae bacterium]